MSKVITKLTPEQQAAIPVYREKWRAIGLDTSPIDQDKSRNAINNLYIVNDLPPPKNIIFCPSPHACLKERKNHISGNDYETAFCIGGQDSFWIAFYDFILSLGAECDAKILARFEAYKEYVKTSGWMYPYEELAIVSDRPKEIHFDLQNRLHCSTGPAISFRDGWGVYAWHGLRIPARLIEKRHEITPEIIEGEDNAEFRRVALEIYGYDNYIKNRKAKLISSDELHGEKRNLYEMKVKGETIRVIEVVNGTVEPDGNKRKFILGAMPGKNPHEVIAASYGVNPKIYKESVRT